MDEGGKVVKLGIAAMLLCLVGCGPEKSNESQVVWGLQVIVKDESGKEAWKCLTVHGGGCNGCTAHLVTWNPDKNGKCFKEK